MMSEIPSRKDSLDNVASTLRSWQQNSGRPKKTDAQKSERAIGDLRMPLKGRIITGTQDKGKRIYDRTRSVLLDEK